MPFWTNDKLLDEYIDQNVRFEMENKDLLLTDEEINNATIPYLASYRRPDGLPMSGLDHINQVRQQRREIAKAQLAKAEPLIRKDEREKIVVWGLERCPHFNDTNLHSYHLIYSQKRGCDRCWEELKSSQMPDAVER